MTAVHNSPYKGSLTREQFLFYEMRTTAKLMAEGLSEQDIVDRIVTENLFQYPTEKSLRNLSHACINRLNAMNDRSLVVAIAEQPSDVAKQICLYAMMKHQRLVWDFMITVIGEKYRLRDSSFGRIDLNVFFLRLQEQDDSVASWSDSTIAKIKSVLVRVLVETEYLDSNRASHLNTVLLNPILENAIRSNNDEAALPAFNCFSIGGYRLMGEIKERLDGLRALMQEDDFLDGKGLSNEVNIRIFCYDAADEMTVRHFIRQIKSDQSMRCRIVECDIYKVFLEICDDMDITEAIPDMEEADGGDYLLEQLHSAIGVEEFIEKIQYSPHKRGDVLLLTGVGDAFPFMRVHTLLEALQPYFSDIPILVMYPGEFNGYYLRLFDRLEPNDYYRAFNII